MERTKDRIEGMLESLKVIWTQFPELRLGQLISNVVTDPYLYYVEDDALMDELTRYYSKLDAKQAAVQGDDDSSSKA